MNKQLLIYRLHSYSVSLVIDRNNKPQVSILWVQCRMFVTTGDAGFKTKPQYLFELPMF